MDFSHSTGAATAGLTSSALGFSDRSLSSLASDLTDNHNRGRMPSHHSMSPTSVGSLSPGLHNPLKQCRSDLDLDDRRGPLKHARTDSFSCRQSDLKMHMNTGNPGASLVRSNSIVSDGRLGCSPTNSCASDGLLGSDATVVSDSRHLVRSDSVVSAPAYLGAPQQGRSPLSYHHQTYHYKPAGAPLPLSMGRDVSHMSMQNIPSGRAPFTSGQWAELEHQALIFKYMMAGVSVPPDLLNPIRKSVAAMSGLSAASHHPTNLGWGAFHLGVPSNADPEPGRCRRTDGKKWRCARDVVPDQKYCERHMHRGRHRSRKPTDGQSTTTSPAATASSSAAANSASVSTNRTLAGSGSSSLTHSTNSLTTTMSANAQQQPQPHNLGMKSFANAHSNSGSGGISIGSPGGSTSSGSQFQLPLQSPPGASALSNKDFRYLNGINKTSDLGIGSEQLLFSETSGSARGLVGGGPDSPAMSNLSRLSSVNHSWQALTAKVPPAPQPKSGNSNSLLHYTSPQMRSLLGQDFGLMPEANQVSINMAQQQQHSFLNNGYGSVEAVSVVRESEGQPLRHFFDDWPRSTRDPTALTWTDVEEERSNHRSNVSTTQLSISIPVTSSDFPTSNPSPSRGKLSLSPLKLSMSRAGEEDGHRGSTDPTHMGLAVGMGMNEDHRHRQNSTTWIPITWETPVGGPLAEVLQQSSTPSGGCKSSGLNLLCDGWDSSPRDSPRMTSPTGVLQKANFSSYSDSSSSGSSPRNNKSEPGIFGSELVMSKTLPYSN